MSVLNVPLSPVPKRVSSTRPGVKRVELRAGQVLDVVARHVEEQVGGLAGCRDVDRIEVTRSVESSRTVIPFALASASGKLIVDVAGLSARSGPG